jgi:hypothetical protein
MCSSTYIFYCEEICLIPIGYKGLNSQLERKLELPYIDYPRMRLVLNTPQDQTHGSSHYVDGKFSLMGKETLWSYRNNRAHYPLMEIATLLQHCILP